MYLSNCNGKIQYEIGDIGRAWVPMRLASNRFILKRIEKMEEACRLDVFCIGTADFYHRYGRESCRWFRNNLHTVETQNQENVRNI